MGKEDTQAQALRDAVTFADWFELGRKIAMDIYK